MEFKVNKYIRLKREEGKIVIYVNGKKINQSKRIILDIPLVQEEVMIKKK